MNLYGMCVKSAYTCIYVFNGNCFLRDNPVNCGNVRSLQFKIKRSQPYSMFQWPHNGYFYLVGASQTVLLKLYIKIYIYIYPYRDLI